MPGDPDSTRLAARLAAGETKAAPKPPGTGSKAFPRQATTAPPADRCPRCGNAFHCGVDDARPCACTGLVLEAALVQQLQARWQGCLCLKCLRALAEGTPIDPPPAAGRAG